MNASAADLASRAPPRSGAAPDTRLDRWTLRQACRIARLAPATVRTLVQARIVRPVHTRGGGLLFSFRDRGALGGLHDIPGSRLRRSLVRLRANAGRRLVNRGARLLVQDRDGTLWDAETGQLALPLADVGAAHGAACVFIADRSLSEIDWFARAAELEEAEPEAAALAYREAVRDAPSREEAWLNLGALLQERGRFAEAQAVYCEALAALPASALLRFNFGVLLHVQDRLAEALGVYERALEQDPALADARHNAAVAHLQLGNPQQALHQFNVLRRLERATPV